MMLRACAREQEIAEAVRSGRWPLGCEPELRAHVDGCRHCRETALLTSVFQQARTDSGAAPLPHPGLLWWRAQLRRRNAAMERVSRPLAGAHVFALALNLVAIAAIFAWQARHGAQWMAWWTGVQRQVAGLDWLAWIHGASLLAMLVLGTLALLGGVAVWLAADR
jgi:hypothetical protein